jgi:hypothetical protein
MELTGLPSTNLIPVEHLPQGLGASLIEGGMDTLGTRGAGSEAGYSRDEFPTGPRTRRATVGRSRTAPVT